MLEKKQVKTLSPKLDVVFSALFGEVGNEAITKSFLESILEKKIEKIDLSKNPILKREYQQDKLGILDILAELDGEEICNIELQVVNRHNIIERILYYWSKLYCRQIKAGQDYGMLRKTIVVLIADFEIEELKELDYHSVWKIMETKSGKKIVLTDKFELDIIMLPKIRGKEAIKDELLDWLYFLDNPKSERVVKSMEENKELKQAVEKVDSLSEDERMQRIADLRQKAIWDEKAILAGGIHQGIKQGRDLEKIEIAKKMLKEMIDIDVIIKITELSKEEIEKINKEMN